MACFKWTACSKVGCMSKFQIEKYPYPTEVFNRDFPKVCTITLFYVFLKNPLGVLIVASLFVCLVAFIFSKYWVVTDSWNFETH